MRIKLQQIISFVNDELELDMNRNTRKGDYVDARCLYYKLAREHTKKSLSEIGKPLGKHHGTVLHSLKNVWDNTFRYNPHVCNAYQKFNKMVDGMDRDQPVNDQIIALKKELAEVDRDEYIRMRKELYKVRKNNIRFNDLLNQLDTDKKKEELFLRLEATVNMLKGAVYR